MTAAPQPTTPQPTAARQPAAAQPPPSITLTAVEMIALLALRGGPAAATARDRLALGPSGPDRVRAGAASLLDRGYLSVDGDGVGPREQTARPRGPGAVLAHVLTAGARWMTIVHGDPIGMSGSIVIDADAASLGITPRPDRSFVVTAFPPGYSGDSVLGASVLPYLDAKVPAAVVVTVLSRDGNECTLTLSRAPDGSWWQRADLDDPPSSTSRAAAASALGALTAGEIRASRRD